MYCCRRCASNQAKQISLRRATASRPLLPFPDSKNAHPSSLSCRPRSFPSSPPLRPVLAAATFSGGVWLAAGAGACAPGEGAALSRPSKTQMIMEKIDGGEEVGGAGGAYSHSALKRLDQIWSSLCDEQSDSKVPEVVTRVQGPLVNYDPDAGSEIFDVLVCSGTLGIFIATALSSKGLRVGIIERNKIKGREHEWNISRKELMQIGILSEAEAEQIISSDFNPNRCGFENKGEIWVENILHLGISPAKLVEIMKGRFIRSGGRIFEGKSLANIFVHDDVAVIKLSDGGSLSCRLVIDAMGNFSPIARQDVIQFGPLVKTLGLVMLNQPQILPSIFKQVGLGVILDWSGHFLMLGYYTFLCTFIDPAMRSWVESLPPRDKFKWKRYLEAWIYGAGLDYRQGE